MFDVAVGITEIAAAALYFDYVVPIGAPFDQGDRLAAVWETFGEERSQQHAFAPRELLNEFLPPSLQNNKAFLTEMTQLDCGAAAVMRAMLSDYERNPRSDYLEVIHPEDAGPEMLLSWLEKARKTVNSLDITQPVYTYRPWLSAKNSVNDQPYFGLTMSQLELVDTNKLTWRQISEFRKDNESQIKLRRLRLFFLQKYSGKDRRYIEDDLYCQLSDYEQIVRTWGFETRAQACSMLLNSKWITGAMGGAIVSAVAGAPATAALAAIGGVVLEIGNISLEITKRHHGLEKITREHPISYISDIDSAAKDNV